MKIFKILTVTLLFFILSCKQEDDDILILENPNVSEEEEEETEVLGSIPVLSDCLLGDINLFDTPVNNVIEEVSLAEQGMKDWKRIEELSDEFNYPGGKQSPEFQNKWRLGYVNDFQPLPTVWTGDQISFENDMVNTGNRVLILQAVIDETGNEKRLRCGMISSNETSSYPLYQEAKVKISNSQLANAVWMISKDTQLEEIDNLEAYGPRIRVDGQECDRPYFANRIHLSHHTFKQTNSERFDYQPQKDTWMSRKNDASDCSRDNDVVWSEQFHIFGVKWESPTKLIYFIDGKKVKTLNGLREEDAIDPRGYTTCGDGLTREMHMLISQAAQPWRYESVDAFWNSDDVKSGLHTKMMVDWIRVYSPNGQLNKLECN
ncbi:family 16 glycosylhydrolase [uncultured Aquimarina sp.]|uniref:family 16 glycosylhydrolase n=1 Tax=uncultured Aquimarina sp. TaxID=575652 RepID=UPI002637FE81|nr:family 16 glycosylhydrolase [uncultured Aquimarina sp.]